MLGVVLMHALKSETFKVDAFIFGLFRLRKSPK